MLPSGVSINTVSATAITGDASSADSANTPNLVRVRIEELHNLLMDIMTASGMGWSGFKGEAIYQS
jgi:hypothetical protein